MKSKIQCIDDSFGDSDEESDYCLNCGSDDLIQTREGLRCGNCGYAFEIQVFEYHKPYDEIAVQHAILNTTQIGYKNERMRHQRSKELENLNRLHSIKNGEEITTQKAQIEISRILNCMNLPMSFKDLIFQKFKEVRAKLKPGTKYRGVDKLVPIVTYACLKLENISVCEEELLQVSKISRQDFSVAKLQIQRLIPEYANRSRENYISQKILEFVESFGLEMEFYFQAKKILHKLWNEINCTKDDVIAGLVMSMVALISFKEQITVNAICKKLGIRMSTIQVQVKKRIFEKFKIQNFVSLVKSAGILKEILTKLGLIELETRKDFAEIVQIKLGNAQQVCNTLLSDHYLFVMVSENKRLLFVSASFYNKFAEDKTKVSIAPDPETGSTLFALETLKYRTGKGPPV